MPVKRDFQEKYFGLIDSNTITSLLGPRRSGKSTFALQYLEARPAFEKVYFNFDELSTREEVIKYGIEKLIQSYLQREKKNQNNILILIDEVQKEPKIFEQIKIIYDKQKLKKEQKYKFILTGSASLDIHKKLSETLAGRVELLRVNPFSLSEAARIKDTFQPYSLGINQIFNPKSSFENLLKQKSNWELPFSVLENNKLLINEIIEYGSLPEVLELDNKEQKQRYLSNYRDTYLEKDIRISTNIGDLQSYSNLLTLLASQNGSLIVKKDLKEKIGIAYNTLDRYLSILKATYILTELEPYIFSASRRLVKALKSYFFDNGIIALLTGFLTYEQLLGTGLIGTRFESTVLNEIIKKLKPDFPFVDFYFWRSSGGLEIDLIIDFKEKIIPCEIKWTDDIKQIKINTLVTFLKDYKRAYYGVVIYNGDFFIDKKNKIIFLPFLHFFNF